MALFYFTSCQCLILYVIEWFVSPVFVWVSVFSSYPSRPLIRRNRERVTQERFQHHPSLRFNLQERDRRRGGCRPGHHVCHRWDRERTERQREHFQITRQYKPPVHNYNVLLNKFPQVKLNQSLKSLLRQKIDWRLIYTLYVCVLKNNQ